MDLNLKGKRALVTGGSKGIGRACAQVLAEEGCAVTIASRDAQTLEAAAADIRAKTGAEVQWKAADLSQRGVAEELAAAAGEKLNAAYIAGSTANAGLMAFTRTLGGVAPADGIRVVGVSPGPVATDRLLSLYRQMAATKLGDAERYRELFKGMAFDRPATAKEIAWTVAFAASPRSSYTSGVYITVDGGLAAKS